MSESLSFIARLVLAWRAWFRILFDREVAARVDRALFGLHEPELSPTPAPAPAARDDRAALTLLSLLQREGRLVDFLEQDVGDFSDADIGAAARVVHSGCKKALAAHVTIEPIHEAMEGSTLTIGAGYDARHVKLIGNVSGAPPYRGVLRHRGWRAVKVELPSLVVGHDAEVLAPAEVEL